MSSYSFFIKRYSKNTSKLIFQTQIQVKNNKILPIADLDQILMDPTKPILDLYGDYDRRRAAYTPQQPRRTTQDKPTRNTGGFNDISYFQLKQNYQELFTSYNQKTQKLQQVQYQLNHYKSQNQKLKQELYKVNELNDKLNASLLAKNAQLQDAYRKLQDQLKKASRNRKNQETIDRLEDGLKQAINVNFQHMRQAAMAELKRCLPRN